jgi:hypothetical protein
LPTSNDSQQFKQSHGAQPDKRYCTSGDLDNSAKAIVAKVTCRLAGYQGNLAIFFSGDMPVYPHHIRIKQCLYSTLTDHNNIIINVHFCAQLT